MGFLSFDPMSDPCFPMPGKPVTLGIWRAGARVGTVKTPFPAALPAVIPNGRKDELAGDLSFHTRHRENLRVGSGGSLWQGFRAERQKLRKILLRHGNFDENISRTSFEKRDEDLPPVGFDSCQHRTGQWYKGIPKNCNIRRDFKIFTALSFDIIVRFGRGHVFKNNLPAEVLCAPVCHTLRYNRSPIKIQGSGVHFVFWIGITVNDKKKWKKAEISDAS